MFSDVLEGRKRWQVEQGKCEELFPLLLPNSLDCVVTSPPYAEQRKKQYGGIPEGEYPAWTVAWMEALRPALKEKGSVLINIREHRNPDGMSDYVHRTRMAVREAGWKEVDELIWLKTNAPPTGPNLLPRRSWERVLWFALDSVPYCNSTDKSKLAREDCWAGDFDRKYHGGHSGSSKAPKHPRLTNYFMSCVGGGTGEHPAAYPLPLAEWMLNLVCPPGGAACDPFTGSGTTGLAALDTGRLFFGMEKEPTYHAIACQRLTEAEDRLRLSLPFAA